jgi:Amt family ammonium transporter
MVQLYGIGLVGIFAFIASFILFMILKLFVGIRVSEEDEYIGLDAAEIGIEAYPEFGKGSQSL